MVMLIKQQNNKIKTCKKKTKSMFSDNLTKSDDVCLTLNNSQKNIKKKIQTLFIGFVLWILIGSTQNSKQKKKSNLT
jgi:hypothetical protein